MVKLEVEEEPPARNGKTCGRRVKQNAETGGETRNEKGQVEMKLVSEL